MRRVVSGTLIALSILLIGCQKKSNDASASQKATTLQVTPEDILTLHSSELTAGPVITGSIQPERRADLRSELSSVVLQVLKENGELVRKGDLLVRLDDTSIRDALNSANESVRTATQTQEQTERQFQRLRTLRESGMASAQALEDAENRRNSAQTEVVAAKARAVSAKQQLQRTEVRAPFDGVVTDRKVSPGDTALVGKELIKVIDPSSMRFEGQISAEKASQIQIGQSVSFKINGYGDQLFAGKVRRIDFAANATTRQVEVLVNFVEPQQTKMAGLYAEGWVEVASAKKLFLKNSAIVREGDKAFVWKVQDNKLQRIAVTLGERDPRRGDYAVLNGVQAGDKLIRNPQSNFKDQQAVQLVASANQANSASAAVVTNSVAPAAAASTAATSSVSATSASMGK